MCETARSAPVSHYGCRRFHLRFEAERAFRAGAEAVRKRREERGLTLSEAEREPEPEKAEGEPEPEPSNDGAGAAVPRATESQPIRVAGAHGGSGDAAAHRNLSVEIEESDFQH